MSRGRVSALVVVSVAAVLLAPTALADLGLDPGPLAQGAVPPPAYAGLPTAAYQGLFAGQAAWSPHGTVVADSGFRPYPNGFSFTNYGADMRVNQVLFAQPTPLPANGQPTLAVAMDSTTMRQTFGNGVCLPGQDLSKTSGCTLTQSAEVVQNLAAGWGAGGHCYGLSTMAAAFFNGQVTPGALSTGAVNSLTTLNDTAQRSILRALVAQYFSATGTRPSSMADAITTLRSVLTPGHVPVTLLIYGPVGGHALTPFAVLDKGNGLFDIAVYDSNIPNQMRAVHVDTVNNNWQYLGAIDPTSANALSWDSAQPKTSLLLGSIDNSVKVQNCVFCQNNSSQSVVSFSPVSSTNAGLYDNIKLLAADGQPLDPKAYVLIPPTNPIQGGLVQGPVLRVNYGTAYAISISGAAVENRQPFAVTVVGKGSTQSVSLGSVTPDTSAQVTVGALSRSVAVVGKSFQTASVAQTTEQAGVSYKFSATQQSADNAGNVYSRVIADKKEVVFRDIQGKATNWTLRISSANNKGKSAYIATGVYTPAGTVLEVEYPTWKGAAGRPHLYLYSAIGGKKIRELPLTKA